MNVAKSHDVAATRGGEAVNGGNDALGEGAVQSGKVGLRLSRKNHTLDHEGSR